MGSAEELESLSEALRGIDGLLRDLADFRRFSDLVERRDPRLEAFLDQVVTNVRDARRLSTRALARLEASRQLLAEETRRVAEEARQQAEGRPAASEPAPVRRVGPPVNIEQITMANPTGLRELVLVADHDAESLQATETMLTEEDFRVLSVRDAFEAVSIYARLWAAIDLVILDFSMPGLSGDLIFDELQAINPKVAAVVSGGYTHPDKLNQMLGRGLSGFLPKPFEKDRFITQIQQVLAHKPPPGAVSRF